MRSAICFVAALFWGRPLALADDLGSKEEVTAPMPPALLSRPKTMEAQVGSNTIGDSTMTLDAAYAMLLRDLVLRNPEQFLPRPAVVSTPPPATIPISVGLPPGVSAALAPWLDVGLGAFRLMSAAPSALFTGAQALTIPFGMSGASPSAPPAEHAAAAAAAGQQAAGGLPPLPSMQAVSELMSSPHWPEVLDRSYRDLVTPTRTVGSRLSNDLRDMTAVLSENAPNLTLTYLLSTLLRNLRPAVSDVQSEDSRHLIEAWNDRLTRQLEETSRLMAIPIQAFASAMDATIDGIDRAVTNLPERRPLLPFIGMSDGVRAIDSKNTENENIGSEKDEH